MKIINTMIRANSAKHAKTLANSPKTDAPERARGWMWHKAYKSYKYGGHKAYKYGGHPAPAGPALPNLINAVSILKSKSKPRWCGWCRGGTCLSRRKPKFSAPRAAWAVLILTLTF